MWARVGSAIALPKRARTWPCLLAVNTTRTVQLGLYAGGVVVGLNRGMRATGRAGQQRLPTRVLVRWLVLLPALLAVFALHVLTAEDAVVGAGGPATLSASADPAGWGPSPATIAPADAADHAVALFADAPGVLQDPWAAGCLLFLAALWVLAVLRRRVPVRSPLQASWWPGPVAGPPLWPVARLLLGVTRT